MLFSDAFPLRLVSPGVRVVVVDDTPALRVLMVRQLELAGHQVLGMVDGLADAVECIDAIRPEVMLVNSHAPFAAGSSVCDIASTLAQRDGETIAGVLLCTSDAITVWDRASIPVPSLLLRKPLSHSMFECALRLAAVRGCERTIDRAASRIAGNAAGGRGVNGTKRTLPARRPEGDFCHRRLVGRPLGG